MRHPVPWVSILFVYPLAKIYHATHAAIWFGLSYFLYTVPLRICAHVPDMAWGKGNVSVLTLIMLLAIDGPVTIVGTNTYIAAHFQHSFTFSESLTLANYSLHIMDIYMIYKIAKFLKVGFIVSTGTCCLVFKLVLTSKSCQWRKDMPRSHGHGRALAKLGYLTNILPAPYYYPDRSIKA